jgi:hypothetical protein
LGDVADAQGDKAEPLIRRALPPLPVLVA